MSIRNGQTKVSVDEEPFSQVRYAWFDQNNRQYDGKELRQNDSYDLLFPYDPQIGPAIASVSGSFSSHSERLLKLQELSYEIEIETKGEDLEKVTVTKKQKFQIEPKTS